MIVSQKNQFQQQLTNTREELRKSHEETRKNVLEKTRLQQQVGLHLFCMCQMRQNSSANCLLVGYMIVTDKAKVEI